MSWLFEEDDEDYVVTMTKCGKKGEIIACATWNITSGNLSVEQIKMWNTFNSATKFRKLHANTKAEVPSGSVQGRFNYKVNDGLRQFSSDSLAAGKAANACILLVKTAIGETATRNSE